MITNLVSRKQTHLSFLAHTLAIMLKSTIRGSSHQHQTIHLQRELGNILSDKLSVTNLDEVSPAMFLSPAIQQYKECSYFEVQHIHIFGNRMAML